MRTSQAEPRTSRNRVTRTVACLVTVLITVLGLTVAGAGAASAQTAQMGPTAEFPYPHDGCTLVPDAPSGVSFNTACNHHDGCYYLQLGRSSCDAKFFTEMVQTCNAHRSTNYFSCLSFAALYYAGVRIFGGYFYNSASVTIRVQTPMNA